MSHMKLLVGCKNPIFGNGKTKVTYGYMDPSYGSKHYGADLVPGNWQEEDVVAIEDGVVVFAKNSVNRTLNINVSSNWYHQDVLGNYVQIKHENGAISKYCHMKYLSVCVKAGDKVKKGQKIGVIGSTGLSTANHVHFEIWTNENDRNTRIDPEPYIMGEKSLKCTEPKKVEKNINTRIDPKPNIIVKKSKKIIQPKKVDKNSGKPPKTINGKLIYHAKGRAEARQSSKLMYQFSPGMILTIVVGSDTVDSITGNVYVKVLHHNSYCWVTKSAFKNSNN